MRRINIFTALIIAAIALTAATPRTLAQTEQPAVVFKAPSGYMQVPMSDFRGALFLEPKKPAGMFVIYPNANETTEALRKRVLAFIAPMFLHDDKMKPDDIVWDTKSLPVHAGETEGNANVNIASVANYELQVATYERSAGGTPFLYGYFGMRHKPGKGDDAKFLDEHGEGVKAFEKFWQSFPK
ncbi:MAG TPA: hypothetical protein VJT50_03370 [Pyrinomonadaceae bacterium]|nr:hypothetical protein [Pyrinomonadaceae bacterium]